MLSACARGSRSTSAPPIVLGSRRSWRTATARYFRIHLVGYFEGIDSERGLEWRCADSLLLGYFLGLGLEQRVPDHSWLSRTRARLPLEVHESGVRVGAGVAGRAPPYQRQAG